MTDTLHIIQLLVAPVIMISASGLICLALYNRLAMIVTRARAFHKERFGEVTRLTRLPLDEQGSLEARQIRNRINLLDEQSRHILVRAKLIRDSLKRLIVTILLMLGCSLLLGLTMVLEQAIYAALAFFAIGVLTMAGSMFLALAELNISLKPVSLESSANDEAGY